jgi:ribosomal protein L7/L12
MPSQSLPQLIQQVDRLEAQVALLSEKLGLPFGDPKPAVPDEVVELAQSGNTFGAIKRYRELTGSGADEAKAAIAAL